MLEPAATPLLSLALLLLAALVADRVAQRSPLPQVTILVLLGVLVGPAGLDVLPEARETWEPVVTHIALVMVGFLVGSDLEWSELRSHGRSVLRLALVAAGITAMVVAGGMLLLGADVRLAFALGGIAAATDPASTLSVIDETRAEGRLSRTLVGIVAIDDALSITLFTLLVGLASILTGAGAAGLLWEAVREIGGGVLLGVVLGVPAAALTGRVQPGRPTLLEVLALVFLIVGLASLLEVSFLLAAIVAGALVVNRADHHERPIREIERIDWPFLAVFFVLGGASFDTDALTTYGLLTAGYLVVRTLGRVAGGWVGARVADAPAKVRRWVGPSLLPQAGVALGLALLTRERFPDVGEVVLAVVVVSTVAFELVGPVVTRRALERAGEVGAGADRDAGNEPA